MARGRKKQAVTMADVAAALGVSTVTVSNALGGKPGVSAELAYQVRVKAVELGYSKPGKKEEAFTEAGRQGQEAEKGSRREPGFTALPEDPGPPPLPKVTQADIAEKLGISTVSVSNALAGRAGVSEAVRARILQTAWQLGYVKPAGSRGVFLSAGVIVADRYISIGSSFYWSMYQAVVRQIGENNGISMLEIIDAATEEAKQIPSSLASGDNNVLIIVGPLHEDYLRFVTEDARVPVVMLDYYDATLPCASVLSGNFPGMKRMTQYLIDRGFTKIGFVGSVSDNDNIKNRYRGYSAAMEAAGLPVKKQWVLEDRIPDDAVHLPKTLPEAFVCSSDYAAGLTKAALAERGLSVPNDISLVGYDDFLIPDVFHGKLTTCRVEMDKMAELAVQVASDGAAGHKIAGRLYEVDCPLVEGKTVKMK